MGKLTPSRQDYLEAILDLAGEEGSARSVDVAAALGFSRASVSRAMSLLREDGYLTQEPYGKIALTTKGLDEAKRVRHTHRMLRYYLIHILEVDEKTAEQDACRMEHVVSETTLGQIERCAARHLAEHHSGIGGPFETP